MTDKSAATRDGLDEYRCPDSCRCRRYECRICEHTACDHCPDCHPEIPDL